MLHYNHRHAVWLVSLIKLALFSSLLVTCNKDDMESFSVKKVEAEKNSEDLTANKGIIAGGDDNDANQRMTAGTPTSENFTLEQKTHDKLDILLVIDESGSMSDDHQSLSTRLDDLLSAVKDSDWQIGIISTNPLSCLLTVIDKNTPNYETIFTTSISQQKLTDSYKDYVLMSYVHAEQAIYGALRGLRGDCIVSRYVSNSSGATPASPPVSPPVTPVNTSSDSRGGYASLCQKKEKWLRDGSMLAVLLVTDEDHQCPHHHGCQITDFYFYLKSIRIPHATGRVYGLLNEQENQKFISWKDNNGKSLFAHHESIVNTDYSTILNKISQNIATALQNTFTLKHHHNGGNTEVIVTDADGETQTLTADQYSVAGNTLTINMTLPADSTEIKITYTY